VAGQLVAPSMRKADGCHGRVQRCQKNATVCSGPRRVLCAHGGPLTCGATPTGKGVYSVANGVYTFNDLDNGIPMKDFVLVHHRGNRSEVYDQ